MPRHTIETIRDTIADLRDRETVYKVEVDRLKHEFSSAFAADWSLIKDFKHLSVEHSNRSESDTSLYFEAPFEPRHWYGKKFSQFLEALPDSDFKDATVSHRNRWRPLFLALEDLKKRQVKGRKPVESTKTVVGTRTQLRAICPCCFKEHAVKGDRLVAHGYTLTYGFQNGNCQGYGKPHFGTEAGRDEAARMGNNARSQGEAMLVNAGEVMIEPERFTIRDYRMRPIENPKPHHIREHAQRIESNGMGLIRYADEVAKLVEKWAPAEPREVQVEVTE